MAVADASLACAGRLLAEGKRARLAAMYGIIREETSINQPGAASPRVTASR